MKVYKLNHDQKYEDVSGEGNRLSITQAALLAKKLEENEEGRPASVHQSSIDGNRREVHRLFTQSGDSDSEEIPGGSGLRTLQPGNRSTVPLYGDGGSDVFGGTGLMPLASNHEDETKGEEYWEESD